MPGRRGSAMFQTTQHIPRWRAICKKLFLLSALALFFLLPLQSDPSASIFAAVLLGGCAIGKLSFPSKLSRYALVAFLGYAVVVLIASMQSPGAMGKYLIIPLWACAILAGIFFSRIYPDHGYRFLLATVAAILISFAIGLVQGIDSPHLWQQFRLKLFAIHPSRLALYCAVAFLFCLNAAATTQLKRPRLVFILLMAAIGACLYLTNTRGVILVLPVGILCVIMTLPPVRRTWLLAVFLLCCIGSGFALWASQDGPLSRRIISAAVDIRNDPTFRTRLPIWEVAWDSFKKAPVIGHGVKVYAKHYVAYVAEHKRDWKARYGKYYDRKAKNAHSIVLGRMVEGGALGTICFLFFYGVVIVAAFRLPREQRWAAALLIFYMGIGVFDDTLFRRNDAFMFFIMGAILGLGDNMALGRGMRQDTLATP